MEDARVRVNRAKTNYQALKRAIDRFATNYPNAQTAVAEEGSDGYTRVIARIKKQPPRDWGLAAGDILVDLRVALDYAIYALAVANSDKDPPDFADKLEFPICETEIRWREAIGRRKVHGLSADALEYIESLQPYRPGNGAATAVLMTLEELVGINKHRFIYVAWTRLDRTELKIGMLNAKPVDFLAYHLPGELKDGTELARYRVERTAPDGYVKVDAKIVTFVAIEPTAEGWVRLDDFLPKMGALTEHYVGALERFLVSGHAAPSPSDPITLSPW